MTAQPTCPVTVVIPTWGRPARVLEAIAHIKSCTPPPAEILVHIDAGDRETATLLRDRFPDVGIFESTDNVGPGGGRNRLIKAASNPIAASFDDDSWPMDPEYFSRLVTVFERRPDAAVVAAQIIHRGERAEEARPVTTLTAHYVGCGAAFRRDDFLKTSGHVPIAVAYGIEEVDLALQLHAMGRSLVFTPWLRVIHDTSLEHHASPKITAASITNLALLAYLRYPVSAWPRGIAQVFNRVFWLLRAGRFAGIATGLARIPSSIFAHRRLRAPVTAEQLRSFLALRDAAPEYRPIEGAAK